MLPVGEYIAIVTTYEGDMRFSHTVERGLRLSKKRLTWLVCVLVTLLHGGGTGAEDGSYRLPETCRPSTYELSIRPDFYDPKVTPTFSGTVVIKVTCSKSTDRMTLHQLNLTILELTVASDGELSYSVEEDKERHFYTIVLDGGKMFKANTTYTLSFAFQGLMRTDRLGLYYTTYLNEDKDRVAMAITQMEPTHARSMFPCFDEPGFKSAFSARVARRTDTGRNYTALFNAPKLTSQVDPKDDRWIIDTFGTTPVMSTYLVAIVVSDLVPVTTDIDLGEVHDGVANRKILRYRTFERAGHTEAIDFAQRAGVKIFSWLDAKFQPPYERFLSKLDGVSDPTFLFGGMENWGLILYKSNHIAYTEGVTKMFETRNVITVTIHELAHQWYGNIVSPKWWDNTWLNEGFASYWMYYVSDQVYPNWKETELAVSLKDMHVMQTDGSTTSHALYHEVATPSEVKGMFSGYSYAKGGAIVRMLHMIMGEHFLPALNQYMVKYQLKAVDYGDLMEALDEYAEDQGMNFSLKVRMPSWVEQKGYPLLRATRDPQGAEGGDSSVVFTQQFFPVKDADTEFKPPYGNRFDIPFIMTTDADRKYSNQSSELHWLERQENQTSVALSSDASWYIVNKQHWGYYRVLYDAHNYKALHAQLMANPQVFDPLTRATLLDDAFTFLQSGGEFQEAVEGWPFLLTQYLSQEFSFPAWHIFYQKMKHFGRLLINNNCGMRRLYSKFIRDLTGPVMLNLTLHIESDLPPYKSIIRFILAGLACRNRERYCFTFAGKAVKKFMQDAEANPLDVNLREHLLCGAVAGEKGEKKDVWNFLISSLKNLTDGGEKNTRVAALSCTSNEDLATELLTGTLSNTIPGLESSGYMVKVVENFALSPFNNFMTLRFFSDNFDAILERINNTDSSQNLAQELLKYLATDTTAYKQAEPLLSKMQEMGDGWSKVAEQIQNITAVNAHFVQKYHNVLKEWLR